MITDELDRTADGRLLAPGSTHVATGHGDVLGPGWLQCYHNPLIAAFLQPIYDGVSLPKLWMVRGEIRKSCNGLIVGCQTITAHRRCSLPTINTKQRIQLAICVSQAVYREEFFVSWTNRWLNEAGAQAYDTPETNSQDLCGRNQHHEVTENWRDKTDTVAATDAAFWTASSMTCLTEHTELIDHMTANAIDKAVQASRVNVVAMAHFVAEAIGASP